MAFLVGFLPSAVSMIVAVMGCGLNGSDVFFYLLLGLEMGVMGFGGAEYNVTRRPLWLVAGFVIWFATLLMAVMAGMH